jgi:hypothetical protein
VIYLEKGEPVKVSLSSRRTTSRIGVFGATMVLACILGSVVPASADSGPAVTGVTVAPFVDQASLAGGSIVIGGLTLTPQNEVCSTSTQYGYSTEKCIVPSSNVIYINAANLSGGSFPAHLEVTVNGTLLYNTPPGATYGENGYYLDGSFPPATYCNIMWMWDGGNTYSNMGEACSKL